jgi:branched-chain amino acid transport system permease protein
MVLLQLLANGIVTGCVYALVALGFGLIYNTTKIFHIAHGIVYTGAAYVFYAFARGLGLDLAWSLVLALVFAILLGVSIEVFIYYPFYRKKASLGVVLIGSLGVYIFLVNFVAMLFGNETKILSPGAEKTFHFGSVILTKVQLLEVIAFVILFFLSILLLKKTRPGKIIRALADNPNLVTVLGVDVRRMRIYIFALGSFLTGVASCLVALDVGMDPNVGLGAFLIAAVAVIVGGVGVFEGAVPGAFVLAILQNLMIWKISARWENALVFLVLIFFLLFRPEGMLGRRRRLEEA